MSYCDYRGIYSTWPQAQLQSYRTALMSCLQALGTGQSVATASYTQGDGPKTVTFREADIGTVTATLLQVERALGLRPRSRRFRRFVYRS